MFAQNLPAEQPDSFLRRLRRRDERLSGLRRQPRWRASGTARSCRAASARRRGRSTTAICSRPVSDAFVGCVAVPTALGTETIRTATAPTAIANTPTGPTSSARAPTRCRSISSSSGTYQFSRGVQTGGAGPSIQANWAVTSAPIRQSAAPGPAPPRKTIQLMREGLDYGTDNLSQLDLRSSKRFRSTGPACASTSTSTTCSTATGRTRVTSTYSTASHGDLAAPDQRAADPFLQDRGAAGFLRSGRAGRAGR